MGPSREKILRRALGISGVVSEGLIGLQGLQPNKYKSLTSLT